MTRDGSPRTDIHQHIWPAALIDALRARRCPPYLDGWTLHLAGEPPFAVEPADHDPRRRLDRLARAGFARALVSLSSPLGIEYLPAAEAGPLLAAYHDGARDLPEEFGVWAATALDDPDPAALSAALDAGCVGLQLPATALADPTGFAACRPLLDVLEQRNRPLFVHPGPAPVAGGVPGWWPALVPYVQQMHAAWFAFGVTGRARHPGLRVCFAMLAGLAPLHGERAAARGGPVAIDPAAFVETSSYAAQAVGAVARALGEDLVVAGSDEPYARYTDPLPGAGLATSAVSRLLYG